MTWDKAAEEQVRRAANTLSSMRDWEANRDAEAIRDALEELRAQRERAEALADDRLRGLKIAHKYTLDTQTVEEACASLVEIITAQRERADRLELQVYALGKNLDAAGCHRLLDQQRIATLEAALRGEVEWRDDPDRPESIIANSASALAQQPAQAQSWACGHEKPHPEDECCRECFSTQPAQETKCARCNGTGEVSCDSVYGCGDPDDGEVSCPDCAGEGQR